jgi:hypothetical protein
MQLTTIAAAILAAPTLSACDIQPTPHFNVEGGLGGQENAFGFGQNYIDVALGTGGAAWDLNALRAGGDSALSFGEAFIDIKVSEIISQPPSNPAPIPLPAAGWLLLAGLGGLGALRRFGK